MKILKKPVFIAIVILLITNIALFWKFYFKGLLPFPGDLLTSYYFPWNSGGFAGFDPWTTRKGVIAMDVIRAMYPWKSLAIGQLKSGFWPLWNPYNFSGTPLLGNIQSSVFFPGNLIFFILPFLESWIFLVLTLPLFFSIFWYMFFKSIRLSNTASILGGIFAANLTYLNVWTEQLVLLQSVFFLPLILLAADKFVQTKKIIYLFCLPILLAFSFFGGHPQTTLYVFVLSGSYFIFQKFPPKTIIFIYLFATTLSSVQLLPTLELYRYSAREDPGLQKVIKTTPLPWENLATIFAPDYYGNPATNNFRKNNYDNSIAYPGIVSLILAGVAVISHRRSRGVNFFIGVGIFGILFAISPLALIFPYFHIPILSTGFLSRNIFFFEVSIAILGAIGLDNLIRSKAQPSRTFVPILAIFSCYTILAIAALFLPPEERVISFKNLVLPVSIFILSSIAIAKLHTQFRPFFAALIFFLAIFEYGYFFNKYQPFSPTKFVFPNHPVFNLLQTTDFDRYFGVDRAYVDNNFATYFRVYSPEGYDPLFIRSYGEILAASNDGKFPKTVPPYDVWVGKSDNQFRKKLFDILAVKYVIDKTDDPQKDWGPNEDRFPPKEYFFLKQVNKWKYYERRTALPRAFLSGIYKLETDPKKTVETFYDPTFDIKTILLDTKPSSEPLPDKQGTAQIAEYNPNKVIINTSSLSPKLLFLSDNYYPGWLATVDGKEAPILKADYTFRAVTLPAGKHSIVFTYDPLSFKIGLWISVSSIFSLFLWLKLKK